MLASESASIVRGYTLTIGDIETEDIMRFLFVPKIGTTSSKTALDRQDYRLFKRPRADQEL